MCINPSLLKTFFQNISRNSHNYTVRSYKMTLFYESEGVKPIIFPLCARIFSYEKQCPCFIVCYKFNCHTYFWIRNSVAGGLVTAVGRDTLNESTNYIPGWQSGVWAQYLLVHPQSKFPPHDTVLDISNNIYTVLDISTLYLPCSVYIWTAMLPDCLSLGVFVPPGSRTSDHCITAYSNTAAGSSPRLPMCDSSVTSCGLSDIIIGRDRRPSTCSSSRSTINILQNDISNSDFNTILCKGCSSMGSNQIDNYKCK